ncbi:MAG TPA: MarP family serine protease [Candidatus Dormibacteraeota bacterium]|nr:MarP family serine protease [Candidatus Dormibacteraeota bacterium]
MDLLDLIIVLLVIAALTSGWRRGLTWVSLSFLGLLVGVLIGAAIAPPIARRFGSHDANTQALIGTGVFLSAVALVQGVGTAVGYRVRVAALKTEFAQLDSGFGSGLAAIGMLIGAWYLGLTFANSPFTRLDIQIKNSAILRALDNLAPRPPAFLGAIQQLLQGSQFPNPFAGLSPDTLAPVQLPADVNTPGITTAFRVTSKVINLDCSEAGSSWPVAPGYVVTNAHVVAGGHEVRVQTPGGPVRAADVVLFDPDVDVAVLRVPGLTLNSLPVAPQDPPRGTAGAVIGYPGGGDESAVPAAVRGIQTAQGRNIYGTSLVTRSIEVLQATVIPGNSGGPVVDRNGTVIGLVFASSTVDPNEGYALSVSQISGDLQAGVGARAPVPTGDCIN